MVKAFASGMARRYTKDWPKRLLFNRIVARQRALKGAARKIEFASAQIRIADRPRSMLMVQGGHK
jgi:hypothetical protein